MLALSQSNYKITLDFTGTSELVKNVNSDLQKIIYELKQIRQEIGTKID